MRLVRALVVLLSLVLPTTTLGSPITFGLDHGSVTLTVKVNGITVGSGAGTLTAGSVTFDPTALTLPAFSLAASGIILAPALPGAYDRANVNITLSPGLGYSSSGVGTNPTTITLGPVLVGFNGTISAAAPPPPPIPFSGSASLPNLVVDAFYNAGQMRLGLLGVKVAEFLYLGQTITINGDIEFVGFAVPEPALLGLLALSGIGLAFLRRR